MVKNAPATPRLVSSRGVINTFRGASLLFIWWISSPGCHKSIPREKSIVFSFCPFPLTPLPPLTLPLRYRFCWVDVSLDLVSLLAVHYHFCALLTFCSVVQIYFFHEKMLEPRWTRHQKQRESWFAKFPTLKNEVMWANISSFYGNLSSSVIYGQWPSRSILDNMKVFLA